jgi:hypothetical protein
VSVAVTQVSNDGTNATYNLTVTNPYGLNGWAVFSGSTKLAGTAAGSATFTVPDGKTYTVFGVSGDGNGTEGYGSTTISPAAPADVLAPVTTSNALATYVSSAAITLSATDAGSGVAATYYKLDGGAQVAGTSINVTTVGSHTIEFWSVDAAGNIEAHKTASFTVTAPVPVDTTAPVTTSNAVAAYVSSAAITLSATDAGSGVAATYYKLDGGAQVAGKSIAVTTIGSHTIEFWSVDVAGNIEAHHTASFTVTAPVPVDVTAPVTASNAAATYVSSASIKLTATDAGSGVAATYYILDGAAQVAGTSINVTAIGAHTLEFWSVDVAGNIEMHNTAAFTVTAPVPVDVTAPVTTSNAVATYVSSAAIALSATDASSGVAATYYKLDGGAQVAGTSITVTTVGSHTIEFWSVDVAGNIEAHHTTSFTITAPVPVDTTAPVTTSNAIATYVSSAAIRLTATDAGSGVAATYYKLDGGAQVAGTSISTSVVGTHTIEFWSVDVAGNIEAHETATFTVTAPAPTPTGSYTVRTRIIGEHVAGRVATLTDTITGAKYTALIARNGFATFTNVPAGTYTLSVRGSKGLRTVRVPATGKGSGEETVTSRATED